MRMNKDALSSGEEERGYVTTDFDKKVVVANADNILKHARELIKIAISEIKGSEIKEEEIDKAAELTLLKEELEKVCDDFITTRNKNYKKSPDTRKPEDTISTKECHDITFGVEATEDNTFISESVEVLDVWRKCENIWSSLEREGTNLLTISEGIERLGEVIELINKISKQVRKEIDAGNQPQLFQ